LGEDPATYPRDPDIVLKLSPETWAKVYLSAEPIEDSIKGDGLELTAGDATEAARILNLFDRYDQARAVVVPSTLIQDHQ
jgi:hypothetical protein